jgi:hypothetical protein
MTCGQRQRRGRQRALDLSVRLSRLLLFAYPAPFRQTYGERLVRVFRDACRAALEQRGLSALLPLWGRMCCDLVWTACGERWRHLKENTSMATFRHPRPVPMRLWVALAATFLALGVELLASVNLYLLEDASPLSQAAYGASPLLRFSYDAVYLSALASGFAACAALGYALVQRRLLVRVGLVVLTFLIVLAGFGGLLVQHAATFFVLLAVFLALVLGGFLLGRVATARATRILGARSAAVLGACVSVGGGLLVNLVALVLHTLSLNLVSHTLYMQAQIGTTHLNLSLLLLGLAPLTLIGCIVCLGRAFHLPAHRP